jgi:hypothetical protein
MAQQGDFRIGLCRHRGRFADFGHDHPEQKARQPGTGLNERIPDWYSMELKHSKSRGLLNRMDFEYEKEKQRSAFID